VKCKRAKLTMCKVQNEKSVSTQPPKTNVLYYAKKKCF